METIYIEQSVFNDIKNGEPTCCKAAQVFVSQSNRQYKHINNPEIADYIIVDGDRVGSEYQVHNYTYNLHRSVTKRYYPVFRDPDNFRMMMDFIDPTVPYEWKWKYNKEHPGYEVTSRGDKRFSPLFMMVSIDGDWISEETYFKKFLKPYYDRGERPPKTGHEVFEEYLNDHSGLWVELAIIGKYLPFTDMFDKNGGQNKFYAELLNDYYGLEKI